MICPNCQSEECVYWKWKVAIVREEDGDYEATLQDAEDCASRSASRAQALQAELDALREQNRWIPVSEGFPKLTLKIAGGTFERSDWVAVVLKNTDRTCVVDALTTRGWLTRYSRTFGVSHWRSLLPPPEEVKP